MSENKFFKITKTHPSDVLFHLSPISNPELKKEVYLTHRKPSMNLPVDWALGIFLDNGLYNMYKQGYFTFSNTDELVKEAIDQGVYFDEKLDFTPKKGDEEKLVLDALKLGQAGKINALCTQYGDETVKNIAICNVDQIPSGVVQFLEKKFGIQLLIDEA